MARSAIIELFSRVFNVRDRKDKIYENGIDNLYPERIERVINNSVTAKLSVDKMISFLMGQGFEINEQILNPKKKTTAYKTLEKVSRDVAYQKGLAIHINYDIEGKVNYLDVLRFKNCRIAEEDDMENQGYIYYSKKWASTAFSFYRKKEKHWYYPYNPDINVINAQRKKDAPKDADAETLLRSYRGQVLFVNFDGDEVYPNAWIDPAYNDADTEHRISIFRNDRIKTGFIGANVVIVPEVQDDKEWKTKQEEFKSLLGSENSSNLLVLEAKLDSDNKLSDAIHIETIKSEVDTEQFQYDEKTVQENILNCYKIPKILVRNNDSALFGPNAESLRTSQQIFQEETQFIRDKITNVFKTIYKGTDLEEKFEIIPLIQDEQNEEINEDVDTDNEE